VLAFVLSLVGGAIFLYCGIHVLRAMAQPTPPPPPPGEMRRVSLKYRCSVCGTEVKMTHAVNSIPEPPRHCMEDMILETPIEV
jgi:hypothetical protein